jgi:hypothetical protein
MVHLQNIEKVVTNPHVFHHLMELQKKIKVEFTKNQKDFPPEMFSAIQESPNTTQWIKDIVLPGIYDGDEGLDQILFNIENEKNIFLGATKMQMLLNILDTLEEPLANIKEASDEGKFSLSDNLRNYEEEKRPFKTLH